MSQTALSLDEINFSITPVGGSSAETVTIYNEGTSNLEIQSINFSAYDDIFSTNNLENSKMFVLSHTLINAFLFMNFLTHLIDY